MTVILCLVLPVWFLWVCPKWCSTSDLPLALRLETLALCPRLVLSPCHGTASVPEHWIGRPSGTHSFLLAGCGRRADSGNEPLVPLLKTRGETTPGRARRECVMWSVTRASVKGKQTPKNHTSHTLTSPRKNLEKPRLDDPRPLRNSQEWWLHNDPCISLCKASCVETWCHWSYLSRNEWLFVVNVN